MTDPAQMPTTGVAQIHSGAIKVDVRVARVMSNMPNERPIRMTVTDKASGLEFLEIRFTREEWADVLTGHSTYEPGADAEVRGLQHIGKRHEHETRTFGGRGSSDYGAAEAKAWAKDMLANGWQTMTSHRNNMAQTVMTVRRYVPIDPSSSARSDEASDV